MKHNFTVTHGCHCTNKNFTAQTNTSRQKQTLHGTNKISQGTNKKLLRHRNKISYGTKENAHGTNKNAHSTNKNSHGGSDFHGGSHTSGYSAARNMAESVELDDDFELGEEDEASEESIIRYYFFRGFEYKEILLLLLKKYNIRMSLSTLKQRIKGYGLRRQRPEYNIDEVRASIQTIINGHGSLQGYQVGMAQTAAQRDQNTARRCAGTFSKNGPRRHRLRRRIYHKPGRGIVTAMIN